MDAKAKAWKKGETVSEPKTGKQTKGKDGRLEFPFRSPSGFRRSKARRPQEGEKAKGGGLFGQNAVRETSNH